MKDFVLKLIQKADGKKSYGSGVLLVLFAVAVTLGGAKLTPEQITAIVGGLGGAAVIALRLAISKAVSAIGVEGGVASTVGKILAEAVTEKSEAAATEQPEE